MRSTSYAVLAALAAIPLAVQSSAIPETRLTMPERSLAHDFAQLRGLRELADGRLLVSDRLEPALYLVDVAWSRVSRIGREGQGPAEYRLPSTLLALPGDSTLVVDEGNSRFLILGPDHRIARSISSERPGLASALWPRAADSRGRLYFQIPRWAMGPAVSATESLYVARIDLRTGSVDTLGRVNGSTEPPGQIQHGIPYVPFAPEDGWQATEEGRVALVRSGDYHIDWREADGRTVRGPVVSYSVLPVTAADRIAYTRSFLENSSIGGRGSGATAPTGPSAVPSEMLRPARVAEIAARNTFAARKPAFTDFPPRAGPDGSLWVERSVPVDAPRAFDVFDGRGRLVRRVTLPPARRLLAVGRRVLYLVAVDEAGLERLEQYSRP